MCRICGPHIQSIQIKRIVFRNFDSVQEFQPNSMDLIPISLKRVESITMSFNCVRQTIHFSEKNLFIA